jgi:ribosomal protein S18 acetylase RimI-like enzyme
MSEEVTKSSIVWLVVLHTNERAIKFYENFGFKKFREHFHQIGTINFKYELMVKEI